MTTNFLPKRASIAETCEWLREQTGEPWTLARLLEYGLMPWFWLEYQHGWPDALFGGRAEGYLAPLCFAGDTDRLAADGREVLVTMTRTHDGKLLKVGPPGFYFTIDELRFLRGDIEQLEKDITQQDAPAQDKPVTAKVETAPASNPSIVDWKEQARKIADEVFDGDTKNGCRRTLRDYAGCVMDLMQERGIKGPRGIIDNPNTIMREALQGDKWWAKKSK